MSAAAPAPESGWVGEVIRFWLEETPRSAWFARSDAMDAAIAQRFAGLHASLAASPPGPAGLGARHALATVIVLDQFSRNLFRGSPEAFASDATAKAVAQAAIEAGHDNSLDRDARLFLYLPFEHSEALADQDLSVALIGQLGDEEYLRFAIAHRDIIRRFGRFPHRNAVLGRPSSGEELAFLREPGSSF